MPAVDPLRREHHVGLGCAVENLVLGLATRGYHPELSLLPDPAEPTPAGAGGPWARALTPTKARIRGLPWAGCTLLVAPSAALGELRPRALAAGDVLVCGMPAGAQTNRLYAEYLDELSTTPSSDLSFRALSLFGPKNRISKLTGKLPLLPRQACQ